MMEEIRAAQPGDTVWDRGDKSSIRGLHIRVLADGTKCFFLYYRTKANQQRRPKIGTLGEITLPEARRRAKVLLDQVAVGLDPKGDWNAKKEELTVSELFEKCWQDHWSSERYQESGWASGVSGLWKRNLEPYFGNLKLSEMTVMMVRAWHRGFIEKPYDGNRALAVLSRMFRYAEEQEIRPQHSNPCSLVRNHPETKRKRYASDEEIKRIAPIMESYEKKHPAGIAFLYLLMLTGSRPRAIERATWDQLKEVSLNGENYGVLVFRGKTTDKTGEPEKVILPPQAMRALNRLPRIEGETITGIKMPRRLWKKIKEEAGISDLWARDWRRTFATVGKSGGIEIGVIGEVLNHKSAQTTKIYAKVTDGTAITAVTTIAGRMEGLMKGNVG